METVPKPHRGILALSRFFADLAALHPYCHYLVPIGDGDGGDGRLVKNEFIFHRQMSQPCKSVRSAYRSKNVLSLNMHRQRSILKEETKNKLWFTFSKIRRTWSFHVVVLQRKGKKYTKIQNARAEPLFCSLNLLFGDALVAVAVVV